ncbi:MAG: glycosyltransferase family 4 protein [Ignavibacteriales bacterium]
MKSIAILVPRFFDFNGEHIIFGGAERYLVSLVNLMRKLGYRVNVFQGANKEFIRTYDGIQFDGITEPTVYCDTYPEVNRRFHAFTTNFDYKLYFSINMCYPEVVPDSLTISHGVWWDNPVHARYRLNEWTMVMEQCLRGPALIVSVDTNTINWVRACLPEVEAKMVYLPNYVDANVFKPTLNKHNIFTILVPRSLVGARGIEEAKKATEILVRKYNNIQFVFVGRGSPEQEAEMEKWARDVPRVKYQWFETKDMLTAYDGVDMVLIPTKSAEGTSFSALEAMATGKLVIAGWVGGLTDLIIDSFNGFLIRVTVDSLVKKVEEVYSERNNLEHIKKQARMTALSFSKQRWDSSWEKILKQYYPL